MRPLALDWLTGLDLDGPGLIRAAAENGVDRVSLLVAPMDSLPDWDLLGDTPARRETRRVSTDLGVAIDGVDVLRARPDTRATDFLDVFESAAYLDATTVCILAMDPDLDRLADTLGAVASAAAGFGLALITELTSRTTITTLPEAAALFARMDAPIGVEVDALHFFRTASAMRDLVDHRGLIVRAQVCDAPLAPPPLDQQIVESRRARLIPGDGELPLVEWVSALPADVVVGVEAPYLAAEPGERIRRAVAETRAILAVA